MKLFFSSLILILLVAFDGHAFYTEVGVSYSRKKTSFNSNNFTDSESSTASLSFYFMESVAIELSYTDGSSVRQETIGGSTYITYQKTKVTGADLIYVFAGKKEFFQPYIKGGGAQLVRSQVIKYDTLKEERLDPDTAIVPSYGVGVKFALTDALGIKISYDAWKTPVGSSQSTDDSNIRAGITWIF